MLTVEDYGRIRHAYRDGISQRAVAKKFEHSRRKARQAIEEPESKPYTRTKPPRVPKLGKFYARIDKILKDDEQ